MTMFSSWASLVAQLVENPPAMWETWVPSLGWEDPLEKGMETHSSILAWRVPWTEQPGDWSPQGCRVLHARVAEHTYTYTRTHMHTHTPSTCIYTHTGLL